MNVHPREEDRAVGMLGSPSLFSIRAAFEDMVESEVSALHECYQLRGKSTAIYGPTWFKSW